MEVVSTVVGSLVTVDHDTAVQLLHLLHIVLTVVVTCQLKTE